MSTHAITFELPKVPTNAKLFAIAKQSARNLISLFADHEAEIQQAITETEESRATFNHAIVLDLGKSKQTDKLGFSIKRGDEIIMSIPDPDQGDLFGEMYPKDLPKRRADVVVDAEIMGLPAPMDLLPAPEKTEEEKAAYQKGKEARAKGSAYSTNPYPFHADLTERVLWMAWAAGWEEEAGWPDQQAPPTCMEDIEALSDADEDAAGDEEE